MAGRKKQVEPNKATETRDRPGRPEVWSQELADTVCAGLSLGQSLKTVLKEDGMPDHATVFRWFRTHPEFLEQYDRAKQESADAMQEDLLDIADDGTNDWMEDQYMKGKSPGWKVNGEAVQRSKLRVDTRKWLMAKMKPKKYGDSLDLTTKGKELPAPIFGGHSVVPNDNRDQ